MLDLALEAPGGPHADRLRSEARARVERALAGLPDPFRQALVLADVAELALAEIAALTGVREATVKTRLHHAQRDLRRRLDADRRFGGAWGIAPDVVEPGAAEGTP